MAYRRGGESFSLTAPFCMPLFFVCRFLVQALLGAVFSAGDASIFVSLLCGLFGGRALYKTGGVIFEFFVL